VFENRQSAGVLLARLLLHYKRRKDVLVLGIPRGGVVTAKAVAEILNLPLDIVVARKIGAPGQEELAIGAVSHEGVLFLDKEFIKRLKVSKDYIRKQIDLKKKEVEERIIKFRKSDDFTNLRGKTVILIDDGIATGSTIKSCIIFLRKKKVKKIILATPVIPEDTCRDLLSLVDEFYFLEMPQVFHAVGQFYREFPQVSDEEVIELLHETDSGLGE